MASKSPKGSLREEVRDALLAMLRDKAAPATARAHAARSLVLLLGEETTPGAQREASGMTIDELDAEIASIQQPER
jgi:hypothetical protein